VTQFFFSFGTRYAFVDPHYVASIYCRVFVLASSLAPIQNAAFFAKKIRAPKPLTLQCSSRATAPPPPRLLGTSIRDTSTHKAEHRWKSADLLCQYVMHSLSSTRFTSEATLTGFEPVLPP